MSAIFNGTTSVITLAQSVLGVTPTYPVLFHALVKLDDLTSNHTLVSVSDDAPLANNDHLRLNCRGDLANDPVQAQSIANNVANQSSVQSKWTTGVWHRVIAYFPSASSRFVWIDGQFASEQATAINTTGLIQTQFGASRYNSAYQNFLKGRMAKVAIWENVAAGTITGTIIPALEAGSSPETIAAGLAGLVLYRDLEIQINGAADVGPAMGSSDVTFDAADHAGKILVYSTKSPDLNDHQGYTTDGTNHYTFDTAAIRKRDLSWNILESKTTDLFTGTQDHVGDGQWSQFNGVGYLLVAIDRFLSCASTDQPSVACFATGAGLPRLSTTALGGTIGGGASAVVRRGTNNILGDLIVTDFCDGTKLHKYNIDGLDPVNGITGLTPAGTITLSQNIGFPQGLGYRDGFIFVSTTATAAGTPPQRVWRVSSQGETTLVVESGLPGSAECLDYNGSQLAWLIDDGAGEFVYFLNNNVLPQLGAATNSRIFESRIIQ